MENKFFRLKRIKAQLKLLAPIPFLLFSLVLMVLSTSDQEIVKEIRRYSSRFFAPIVSVLSRPMEWGEAIANDLKGLVMLRSENKRLSDENKQLLSWKLLALKLADDQKEMAKLVNYIPLPNSKSLTARVLAENNSPFQKSVIIGAGRNQGVSKGDAAFGEKGLFGRVVETDDDISRVIQITSYLSRLPVMVGEERILCIATGDNSPFLKLTSIPEGAVIQKGDVVRTSGHAGVYPSGLGIGVVDHVGEEISLIPFENEGTPEFLRIVNYGLIGILQNEENEK